MVKATRKEQSFISVISDDEIKITGTTFPVLANSRHPLQFVRGTSMLEVTSFPNTALFIFLTGEQNNIPNLARLRSRYRRRSCLIVWLGAKSTNLDRFRNCEIVYSSSDRASYTAALSGAVKKMMASGLDADSNILTHNDILWPASSIIQRLDFAADAIADLRINSAAEIVDELRSISASLSQRFETNSSPGMLDLVDRRKTIKEALAVSAKCFDYVENSRLAGMMVAGCATALVGSGGWSSTACLALTLASWHGKDAFLAALKILPPHSRSRGSKT